METITNNIISVVMEVINWISTMTDSLLDNPLIVILICLALFPFLFYFFPRILSFFSFNTFNNYNQEKDYNNSNVKKIDNNMRRAR